MTTAEGPTTSIWMRPERSAVGRPAQWSRAEITGVALRVADSSGKQTSTAVPAGVSKSTKVRCTISEHNDWGARGIDGKEVTGFHNVVGSAYEVPSLSRKTHYLRGYKNLEPSSTMKAGDLPPTLYAEHWRSVSG